MKTYTSPEDLTTYLNRLLGNYLPTPGSQPMIGQASLRLRSTGWSIASTASNASTTRTQATPFSTT